MSSTPSLEPRPEAAQSFELRKLQAEAEKTEAERDKTLEELRQSRQFLTRLSKVFTPLVAALTIVFGYLAATYNHQVAQAKLEKAQAELEKAQAELEKKVTVGEKDSAQHDLGIAKEQLAATKHAIELANTAKENANRHLASVQSQYAGLETELQGRITFGNLQQLINILDSTAATEKTTSSRYIEDIKAEIARDNRYKAARLSYVEKAAQSLNYGVELRALLYYALFQASNDNRWLDEIMRLASQYTLQAWPTFSSLLQLPYFDLKDIADIICSCYSAALKPTKDWIIDLEAARRLLFTLPRGAFLRCRKPYLDGLLQVRKLMDDDAARRRQQGNGPPIPSGSRLSAAESIVSAAIRGLSERRSVHGFVIGDDGKIFAPKSKDDVMFPSQAVLVWYVTTPNQQFSYELREEALYTDGVDDEADALLKAIFGDESEWIRQHPKLVNAWTSPDLAPLANCSDSTMLKILSGHQLTEADLP